ncbi:MAG: peptide chain release factor N(5)-glutamine methyltransferase [Cyanobacteria bacterium REEB67]|nr:peptide chain release factor N(5)-glutamine methyltransferase [Cyanobacteria bacterium REEB67]
MEKAEAMAEAELMLRTASGLSAAAIVLRGHERLADSLVATLAKYVERRSRREPLQHILGESYFMGLSFAVSSAVLIPRPETEILVERAKSFIEPAARANAAARPVRVFEIGAGSGVIGLSLLKFCPQIEVVACEVSPAAAAVCLANARSLGVASRFELLIKDFLAPDFDPLKNISPDWSPQKNVGFDLFLSNPPYVRPDLMPGLAPEVKDYEPHLALQGPDADGLGFYRAFAARLPALSGERGAILLAEFGEGQGPAITAIFETANWQGVRLLPDLSGKDRIVMAGWGRGTL